MRARLSVRVLWILAGACAGLLVGFALLAAVAGRIDVNPQVAAACGGALGALATGIGPRVAPSGTKRCRRRALAAAVGAAAFLLVARPFQLSPLRWELVGSAEAGKSPRPASHASEWGSIRRQVFGLHAAELPDDVRQPWRHRLEANTHYLCALGHATLHMEATLPRDALIDPATGLRRGDANGVTARIDALLDDRWTTVATAELDSTIAEWKPLVGVLPQGTQRAALVLDARGSLLHDAVSVAMEAPRARTAFGVSLAPLLRLGEFLAAWLALFLGSLFLERAFVALSRHSRVPVLHLARTGGRASWRVRAAVLAFVLGTPLAFAVPVAPWLEALVTPVVLDWSAPEGAGLKVRFGAAPEDVLPAIRIDDRTWRADLPPRPSYRLALEPLNANGQSESLPREVRLLDSRTGRVFASALADSFEPVTMDEAAQRTDPPAVPRFECALEFTPARSSNGEHLFFLWLGGVVILSALLALGTLLVRNATTREASLSVERRGTRPILLAGVAAAVVACTCVLATPPRMTEDSYLYLAKGVILAERGTVDTGIDGLEAVRTPGYPGWLSATIKLAGLDVDGITLAQALLLVGALVFVALSLRGVIRTRWLVAGVLLGVLSPTQQHFARDLMSETVFVSLCLVALGCHFFAHASSRSRRMWWLGAAAVATAAAMLTRVNAVALLAIPAALWLSSAAALWRSQSSRTAAAKLIARASWPYASIALVVASTITLWSLRNQRTCGYFGVSSMVALSDMQGEVQTGMLDPRVLERRGFYPDYVRTKVTRNGEWSSWFIHDALYRRAVAAGVPEREQVRHVELQFADMVAESNAALPIAGRLVKFVRATWWNFQFAPSRDFVQSQVLEDFRQWGSVAPAEYARTMQATLLRDAGVQLEVREPDLGTLGELLLKPREWYAHVDCPLLLLGFAAACWMLARGRPALAAPFLFVLANFALLSYLRQQEWRYMGVMDVFLVLQLVIALGYVGPAAGKQDRLASR